MNTKVCKKCNTDQLTYNFYIGRNTCKDCIKLKAAKWAKDNKEARNAIVRRSRHKSDVWQNYANEYKKTSGDVATRRASKDQRTPNWLTDKQYSQIAAYYKLCNRLTKCLKTRFHVDHILPLRGKQVSGLHVPWNLQVISAKQNLRKGYNYV